MKGNIFLTIIFLKMLTTDNTGNICQMKNRVETNPKGSNLVCLFLLSGSSDIQDVLEVVITELGVIVDPQRLSIASLHRVSQ